MKAYCNIPEIFNRSSTGGVASGLAYSMLKSGFVEGVLVSRRYETFIAYDLSDLLMSCGSIYEDFEYYKPDFYCGEYAQIGKPCDIDSMFKFKISLFCSSIFSKQSNPIVKEELRKLSSTHRYLKGLRNRPNRCKSCSDHVGSGADISVGDSQTSVAINHVIVWSKLGKKIWDEAVKTDIVSGMQIRFSEIKDRQPYLWRGGKIKWMVKKLLQSS